MSVLRADSILPSPRAGRGRGWGRPHGMTLVELMMAFAILVTGLTAIFGLLLAGTRSHRRALKETEATQCAATVLAELRSGFARGQTFSSDNPNNWQVSADFPSCAYLRTIVPLDPRSAGQANTLALREFFVRVKVRWSEKGENQAIELNTIMYRNADYRTD